MKNSTLLNFEDAKQCIVLDHKGKEHVFSSVLKDGKPYLISLLRHYGCLSCSEHIESFLRYKQKLKDLGLSFVFIGNGKYPEMVNFVKRMNLVDDKLIVVTDPTLKIFKKMGLEYSITSTVHYKSAINAIRAHKKGHRNLSTNNGDRGSHFQQGGLLMLDSSQRVEYYFRSLHLGDKPSGSELVQIAGELF